ncbi:hypothetical protein HY733_02770, partial [Candidatus Uhrbacteria bacterium]|nr:hypothetical protein [Candidatus Uhrbacteria bacterium]
APVVYRFDSERLWLLAPQDHPSDPAPETDSPSGQSAVVGMIGAKSVDPDAELIRREVP